MTIWDSFKVTRSYVGERERTRISKTRPLAFFMARRDLSVRGTCHASTGERVSDSIARAHTHTPNEIPRDHTSRRIPSRGPESSSLPKLSRTDDAQRRLAGGIKDSQECSLNSVDSATENRNETRGGAGGRLVLEEIVRRAECASGVQCPEREFAQRKYPRIDSLKTSSPLVRLLGVPLTRRGSAGFSLSPLG